MLLPVATRGGGLFQSVTVRVAAVTEAIGNPGRVRSLLAVNYGIVRMYFGLLR
jgi:hypothetical protein